MVGMVNKVYYTDNEILSNELRAYRRDPTNRIFFVVGARGSLKILSFIEFYFNALCNLG